MTDTSQMQKYTLTKDVLAQPMARQAYCDLRGWQLPADENGNDDGFLVEDPAEKPNTNKFSGYVGWLTADEFHRTAAAQ